MEKTLPNNLQMYHKMLSQLCQWLPHERITRLRNMALLMMDWQLKLFRYVQRLLPSRANVVVLADAGFESVKLLSWLRRQGWTFIICQNGRTQARLPLS